METTADLTKPFVPSCIMSREWTGRPTLSFVLRDLNGKFIVATNTKKAALIRADDLGWRAVNADDY